MAAGVGRRGFFTLFPNTLDPACSACSPSAWYANSARTAVASTSRTPPSAGCCSIDPASAAQHPIYTAASYEACNHTGYQGRTGIFELLRVDEPLRALIHDEASEAKMREHARQLGMVSIRDDGLRWVGAGLTSIEEVLRVTRE